MELCSRGVGMGWSHYAAVMPRFYNNVHWNIENTCYRNTLQITPSNIKHIYILNNIVGWYLLSLKNQSFCTILPHLRETENPNRLVYSFINFFTRVLLPDPLGPDTTRGLKLDILPKKNKAKCESRFEKIKRNPLDTLREGQHVYVTGNIYTNHVIARLDLRHTHLKNENCSSFSVYKFSMTSENENESKNILHEYQRSNNLYLKIRSSYPSYKGTIMRGSCQTISCSILPYNMFYFQRSRRYYFVDF